jgi:hypothetical protein
VTNYLNTDTPCVSSGSQNYIWTTKRERQLQFNRFDACYTYEQADVNRSFLNYFLRNKDSLFKEELILERYSLSHLMIYEIAFSVDTTIIEIDLNEYLFRSQPDSIDYKNSRSLKKQFLDSCFRYFNRLALDTKRIPNDRRGIYFDESPFSDPFKNATPAEFPNKNVPRHKD